MVYRLHLTHSVMVLLVHLAELALEIDLDLEVQVSVVPRVLPHRERACYFFALFYLRNNKYSTKYRYTTSMDLEVPGSIS